MLGNLIATCLLILTMPSVQRGPSARVVSGRAIEREISADGLHWSMVLPGTQATTKFERNVPVAHLTVRACSADRVLETHVSEDGAFRFVDVPPGVYNIVAGNPFWGAATVRGVSVEYANVGPITIDMSAVRGDSPCMVDDTKNCAPTHFAVAYEPRTNQQSAVVRGTVIWSDNQGAVFGVSHARIAMHEVHQARKWETTKSDRQGRFEFQVSPGIYELSVSRPGFQDVRGEPFLVTQENPTRVIVSTAKPRVVVVCQ